jgi:diguanylate cyclase (GGDEF)-like protein/PAS domain S-box-containing protein
MKLDDKIYKQMLDNLGEAVYFVDTRREILYWNRAAEALTGFAAGEVIHRFCYENILQHVDEQMRALCEGRCPLLVSIETGRSVEKRVFLSHRKGHRVPVNVKVFPITDEAGGIIGAVEVFSDATAFIEVEQLNVSLQNLIRIDSLTQLPNRRAMMEALEREYQRFLRYSTPLSLIFADVDHFKKINDTFGHPVGDRALQWVARNLAMAVRKADMVGRFGGEEFMILLTATDSPQASRIAENLRAHLAGLAFPGTGSAITASFGVTAVRSGDSLESLLDRVDAAMYRAKERGRNRVSLDD